MSQRQLAFPGCSPAYISRIEAGDRIPSLQLLRELGRRLGVSEDYLATGSELPPQAFSLLEAEVALRLDDLDRGEALYTELLEQALTPTERSQAEEGLGHLALRQSELQEAIAHFERALVLAGDDEWERPALAESLGRAYALVGELDTCVAIFERCLDAFRRDGDRIQAIRFACLLGYALSDAGEFARAEEVVGHALAEARESFDPYMRARVYWARAKLEADRGEIETASRYAYQALAALEFTEDLHYTGIAHQLIAQIELGRGRAEEALEHLSTGWPLVERSATPIEQAKFRVDEARALARLGRTKEAAQLAVQVSELIGDAEPGQAGQLYALLASVAVDLEDTERAERLYRKAIDLLERQTPNRDLVDVYAKFAELLEGSDDDEAYAFMKKAIAMQQALTGTPSRSV